MQLSAEIDKKIASVTLPEINAAFRKYVTPQRLVIGTAGSFGSALEPSRQLSVNTPKPQ